jgi:hypothetical protein
VRSQGAEAPNLDASLPVLAPEMWQELLSHVQEIAQRIEGCLQDTLVGSMSHPDQACAGGGRLGGGLDTGGPVRRASSS